MKELKNNIEKWEEEATQLRIEVLDKIDEIENSIDQYGDMYNTHEEIKQELEDLLTDLEEKSAQMPDGAEERNVAEELTYTIELIESVCVDLDMIDTSEFEDKDKEDGFDYNAYHEAIGELFCEF